MDALWTPIIDYINSLPVDCENVMQEVSAYAYPTEVVELRAELPSYLNLSICDAQLRKWKDIQKSLGKPMRVYAVSYNILVEKWFSSALRSDENIFITAIPYEWKARYRQ